MLFEYAERENGGEFKERFSVFDALLAVFLQMKSWKKRFFVLSEASLGYYKTIEASCIVFASDIFPRTGVLKIYVSKIWEFFSYRSFS